MLFVPLSLLVWDFGGDGSRDCCITMECEALGLQHTVKSFRLVHSNGERLLSICIFENLFNMNAAGYLLVMKAAVVGMIWVFLKKQNKHPSIISTSEKATEAYIYILWRKS